MDKLADKEKEFFIYFIKNNNESTLPVYISKNTGMSKSWASSRCVLFHEKGLLEREVKDLTKQGMSLKYSYRIDGSIKALKTLVNNLPMENIRELMEIQFYQKMIPDIIEHFEEELVRQNKTTLNALDKSNLSTFLKCSPSCLKLTLDNDYEKILKLEEYDKIYYINEVSSTMRTVLDSLSNKFKSDMQSEKDGELHSYLQDENFINTLTCEVSGLLFLNSISRIFGLLETSDYADGYISKEEYFRDLAELQNNMPKIEHNINFNSKDPKN